MVVVKSGGGAGRNWRERVFENKYGRDVMVQSLHKKMLCHYSI